MDQTSTLSDALLKSTALLSGYLSQIGGSFHTGAMQNDAFSCLLSQQKPDLTAQMSQAQTVSSTASPSASSAASSSATDSTSNSSDASSSASDLAIKSATSLCVVLHKILIALRQKNSASSSGGNDHAAQNQNTPSSPSTASGANATGQATQAAPTEASSSAPAAATASSSTDAAPPSATDTTQAATDPAQALSDIIAELLAMTQMIVRQLQQAQLASGGSNATVSTNQLAAAALANATKDITGTTGNAADLTDASKAGETPTDPLLELLKTMEQGAQQMLAATTNSSTATGAATASSASVLTVAEISAQLMQQSMALKTALANLQQQTQNALAAKAGDINAAVITGPATSAADKTNTASERLTKVENTAAQNQIFAAPAIAPSPSSPNASNSFIQAASDKAGLGREMDSDSFSSGGHSASSFAGASTDLATGLSAEGAQATGTYSFASTLSAFRATNGGSVGLPSAVDQVILQMSRSVKSGNDQMSLQLQPGDLGKITIKLNFGGDGKVQGTVIAENPQTLDLLQKDSRSLERALQDAGLQADAGSLQFSLGGQGNNHAGQTANNNNQDAASANGNGTKSASDSDDAAGIVDVAALAETYYVSPRGVNIRV